MGGSMIKRLKECIDNNYDNRIAPFLWLHGEDDSLILDEIDKIYDSSIRGICVESRTHEDFGNKEWWDDLKLILNHCKEKDMKVWILDDKHFPSGYANGSFREKYAHLQRRDITTRHIDVVGPMSEASFLADAWKESEDEEIIAAILCKRTPESGYYTAEDTIDVTNMLKDGILYTDIPEGYWRVVFVISAFDKEPYFRYYSDKLNPTATDVIIDEIYEPHYRELGKYFGNTLVGFFSDEPGFHNNMGKKLVTELGEPKDFYPWGNSLKEAFVQKFGEHFRERIVDLFFDVGHRSRETREFYMDSISMIYSRNYTEKLAEWCNNHNVQFIGHIIEDNNAAFRTGATGGNYFRALEGQDMSGIDVVSGQLVPGMDDIDYIYDSEFFSYGDHRFFRYTLAKLASSMAHTNKKMNGNAMCEMFGNYGWSEGTKTMKWLTDFMLVRGINYFVPHAFSPKENDTDCPPNFYARGQNPQFKYFKNVMSHMNRGAHLLTYGMPVISCGVLYDTEVRWNGGKFLSCDKIAEKLLNSQIDFDYICHDYLINAEISDGIVKIGPACYKTIIVPYAEYMPEKILERLTDVERAGVEIIWVDGTSEYTTSGEKAKKYFTKANPVFLSDLTDLLYEKDIFDVKLDSPESKIKFCHRRNADENTYFFVNENIHENTDIRVMAKGFSGGNYIVYDSFTNEVYKKYSEDGTIELSFSPYQSLFVITGTDCNGFTAWKEHRKVIEKEFFDYNLSLASPGEPFIPYKHLSKPVNVTGANEVKDFSGHMRYEGSFFLETEGDYEIDLGRVGEAVELWVNGKKIGERICPPYSFDISKAVKKGENHIVITVSNTLVFKQKNGCSRFFAVEPSGLLDYSRIYRLI